MLLVVLIKGPDDQLASPRAALFGYRAIEQFYLLLVQSNVYFVPVHFASLLSLGGKHLRLSAERLPPVVLQIKQPASSLRVNGSHRD